MEEKKKKGRKVADPVRDRNTAFTNIALAAMFLGLAVSQKGGFASGRFVLYMVLAAVNIVSAGIYYRRYRKQ